MRICEWIKSWPFQYRSPLSKLARWRNTMSGCCTRTSTYFEQLTFQKLHVLDYKTLSHPLHLSPIDYYFFKHLDNFLRRKIFINQDDVRNIFRECRFQKPRLLCRRNHQACFLFTKMYWLQWLLQWLNILSLKKVIVF